MTQIPIPAPLIPLAAVGSAVARHFVGLTVFTALLLHGGLRPTALWAGILVALPLTIAITAGCALTAAATTVLHRDTAPTIGAAMLPLFFATPVIYPPHIVPGPLRMVMDLNPLTPVITAYRDLLLVGRMPPLDGLFYSATVAACVLGIGVLLVRRIGRDLPERL